MIQDARVYSIMVEHDRVVPMIEQIDQIMDALLDHERDRETPMQCSQRGSPSVLRVGPGRNRSPSSPGGNFARG